MTYQLEKALKELKNNAIKLKKKSALVITITTQKSNSKIKIFPIRYVRNIICLPIGLKSDITAKKIIRKYDGLVDIFFIDSENKIKECQDLLKKYKISQ